MATYLHILHGCGLSFIKVLYSCPEHLEFNHFVRSNFTVDLLLLSIFFIIGVFTYISKNDLKMLSVAYICLKNILV